MRKLIVTSCVLLLAACSAQPQPEPVQENADLAAFSVVSVTDPAFSPRRGDKVSWVSEVIFVGRQESPTDQTGIELIRQDVEANLRNKGYELGQGVDVDYRIIALVQVGDEQLSEEMRELFRLYPSLGRQSQHEEGMLIVAVARPGSVEALWRGAIQVFVDDQHQLSDEQRRQRLQLAVKKVMSSMPRAL